MKFQTIGEEVSVEGAVVQAAQALDFAGRYAQESRDAGALIKIAESWTKVADFIVALGDHDESKERESRKPEVPFGIQASKCDTVDHVIDDGQLEITLEEEDD